MRRSSFIAYSLVLAACGTSAPGSEDSNTGTASIGTVNPTGSSSGETAPADDDDSDAGTATSAPTPSTTTPGGTTNDTDDGPKFDVPDTPDAG
ncbi:MAG: hypothetical protein KUG77_21880, partial [Nannocystaceae bacterium]|nr:hypothetical protein [Nannocystaceae bacterium]